MVRCAAWNPVMILGTMVIRSVVFELKEEGALKASVEGLAKWLSLRRAGEREELEVALKVFRVSRVGLLVQELPNEATEVVWEPIVTIKRFLRPICKFHVGTGEETPSYCVKPALTVSGYCADHRTSTLALYEQCVKGEDRACLAVDQSWVDEEYVVYVLDYGSERLKVGMTRSWRFLTRVAEQPHLVAAKVSTHRSALEARAMERRLSSKTRTSEALGVRIADRMTLVARLASRSDLRSLALCFARKAASLGLRGSVEAVTILPRLGVGELVARHQREASTLRSAKLVDYGYGLLVFESADGGKLVLQKGSLLHRSFEGSIDG